MWSRLGTLLLLLLSLSGIALSQATLEGSVQDPRGRAVPDATVVLRSEGNNNSRFETSSDGSGRFGFAGIAAGAYSLRAEADGFYASEYRFTLRPRQPLSIVLQIEPRQAVRQSVEVRSNYQVVDPEKTGSSQTFTRQELEKLPDPMVESMTTLAANLMPGASQSHDNFINVRGNEFSLHEFINGVSFLENTQQQFSPGASPQIFETVDLITGGFAPEYGNRFGGVLDIATRSGRSLGGHGDANFRGATLDNYDLNGEYGGQTGKMGYYFFADSFTSGRYLDPPEAQELHDFGAGFRGAAQLDWSGEKDGLKLLLLGGGTDLQQPNLAVDQAAGRNASRHLRQETAILSWLHTFSDHMLLSTSVYQRAGSDRILPTRDPVTPFSFGSRSTLTAGTKTDFTLLWHGHVIKTGVDLVRLRELESFFLDGRGDPDVFPIDFRGGVSGGQTSAYVQDHFSPFRNLAFDVGVRYDHFDLITTQVQASPRMGVAYRFPRSKSVIHAAYNRLFSPPPLEYSLLASFIGDNAPDPDLRVGKVRAYTQNYFEAGWAQELYPNLSLELNAYAHTGHNSFENHEISISRLFLPINFRTARSSGAEVIVNLRQLERAGISGRFQYAVARTFFYGPVTGGFSGNEPLSPGERIQPAFDQTHTGTANLFYRSRWRRLWAGAALRYGSGTIVERGPRLQQHLTADLATGLTLWNAESRRLDLELDATNVSDNRYKIAKESAAIPIQYAPSRTMGGSLKFHF